MGLEHYSRPRFLPCGFLQGTLTDDKKMLPAGLKIQYSFILGSEISGW